jgi:hypothetical protein
VTRARPKAAGRLLLLLAGGCAGCGDDPTAPQAPTDGPAAPGPAAAAPAKPSVPLPVFVDVAESAGVAVENHTGKPREKDWIVSGMGGGTIVLDYDQDGRMDLVVVDGTMLTAEGELQYDDQWRTRVFHNDGGMKFTDVTAKSGVDLKAFGFGGASCDYDADGFPDFYVCCWGRSYLYRNRGDGTFEEVAEKRGVAGDERDMSTSCCWGDVNGDGFHDLYVANYVDQWKVIRDMKRDGKPGRSAIWRGFHVYVGPTGLPGQKDRLYFGQEDGTFREVTATNLEGEPDDPMRAGYGFQPIMSDLDNDGDLDIYVPNDTQNNYLYVNDGKGKFVDRGVESGAAVDFDAKPQASMGVDAADIDRDGWLDLFLTHFSHDHNTLYVNQTGRARLISFQDESNKFNVTRPSQHRLSWGTRMWDYDNDRDLDLFVACGHVYGEIDRFEKETGSSYKQRCLLQRSRGAAKGHSLEDVTDQGGPAFELKRVWRGSAFGDFDDDGDQDVYVTALNDKAALFRNDGGNRNNFLVFRLVGKGRQRDPSGARVTVFLADGKPRMEELHHGASFCNDNDPRLFFGLGPETAAKRVDVRWPGGETQSFENVAGRKFWVIEQGKSGLREDRR